MKDQTDSSATRKRRIPEADITGFTPPAELLAKRCSPKDYQAIITVREELVRCEAFITSHHSLPTIEEILQEANREARTEQDIHPGLYDKDTMNELKAMDKEYQGDKNVLLDGLDEYGNPW